MGIQTPVRMAALLLAVCAYASASADSSSSPAQWAQWVQRQVSQLPASRAIQAEQERLLAQSRALSQPLYNPSLNIDYEDSLDITQTVGLSQTLDWSGKARARLLADSLNALVAHAAAREQLAAAREQEQQLRDLTDLIRRREQAGDVGQVDAQLAYLSLGQAQQALADAESAATRAATTLRQQLASQQPAVALPAADRWQAPSLTHGVVQRLPTSFDLQLAEQQLALAERGVSVADKQRNTDPTLGLRVGQEGGENLWGVDFSLPLKFFNTGKPGYEAALADSEERRALLEKTRNDIQARLDGALSDYQQRRERWETWQQLTGDSLARSDTLLKRVWQQGELTTQNYLQALNQRLDTRLAGIALRDAMQQAWVQWLYESAQLNDWLNQLANE